MFLHLIKGLRSWKSIHFLKEWYAASARDVLTSGHESAVKPCVPVSSARFMHLWLSQSQSVQDSDSRTQSCFSFLQLTQNPRRGSANDVGSTFASWPPGLSVISNLKSPGLRVWTEINTYIVVTLAHGGVRGVEPRAVETLPVPQYL